MYKIPETQVGNTKWNIPLLLIYLSDLLPLQNTHFISSLNRLQPPCQRDTTHDRRTNRWTQRFSTALSLCSLHNIPLDSPAPLILCPSLLRSLHISLHLDSSHHLPPKAYTLCITEGRSPVCRVARSRTPHGLSVLYIFFCRAQRHSFSLHSFFVEFSVSSS